MDMHSPQRAGAPREIERLQEQARRLAREIAMRHPQALALACTRAGGMDGAALAHAWTDMVREGEIDLRAAPLAKIVDLLDIRPDETRGPLRRRLARLVETMERWADADMIDDDDCDAQAAA